MEQALHDDRRNFLRVTADFGVEVERQGGGEPFAARTVNISAGGAKLVAEEPVALNDELRLEIRFKGPTWLVFTDATVVRIEKSRPRWVFAVRFHGLDRYIEQRIVRWVFAEDRRAAERRAAVRVPLNVLAWCRPAGGGRRFRAGTIDLAADGARIITPTVCEVGDRIEIRVRRRRARLPRRGLGEIVWWSRCSTAAGRTACASSSSTGRPAPDRRARTSRHGGRPPPSGGGRDTPK